MDPVPFRGERPSFSIAKEGKTRARERPRVFDDLEESFAIVLSLAKRYSRILEVSEVGKDSLEHMFSAGERRVRKNTEGELKEILEATQLSEKDKKSIAQATVAKNFSGVASKDANTMFAVFGLRAVVEQANNRIKARILESMNSGQLEEAGMSPIMRDGLAAAVAKLSALNFEHVRFFKRASAEGEFPKRLYDTIEERRRICAALEDLKRTIETGNPESLGPDMREFLEYLGKVIDYYSPTSQKGTPYTNQTLERKAQAALDAFNIFYETHPDFPLVIFPAGGGLMEESLNKKVGSDHELLIAWQSPDQSKRNRRLELIKEFFISKLQEKYPNYVTPEIVEEINKMQPRAVTNIASFGLHAFTSESTGINSGNVLFLFENSAHLLQKDFLENVFTDLVPLEFKELVRREIYMELFDTLVVLHELMHAVFPIGSEAAQNLGDIEAHIRETKSDTLAHMFLFDVATLDSTVSKDQARVLSNLAMLSENVRYVAASNPEGDNLAYRAGAVMRLHVLAEAGIFREVKGRVDIDPDMLKKDWSEILAPYSNDILRLYHEAEQGAPNEKFSSLAKQLIMIKPDSFVQKFLGQVSL